MVRTDTAGDHDRTPIRAVRIPDDLWQAAQRRAAERGETVSDAIRRSLTRYVRRPAPKATGEQR